jgi:hypothetical protein
MAPAGAQAPVQYRPRSAGHRLPYAGQFLSKQRTALALAELFGIPCSSGTVAALTARAAGRLDGFTENVRGQIAASDAAGLSRDAQRERGGVTGEALARQQKAPPGFPGGAWCSRCRRAAHSVDMTSLMAARAADWSMVVFPAVHRCAMRTTQFCRALG